MGTAAEIITHLQADGLHLHADDERLLAEPRDLITDSHRALIRTHKPELLAHLRAANEPDDHQADLAELVEERAAIMEFDGGLSREEAERIAKSAARDYYDHLMAQRRTNCGCCTNIGSLTARFCPEGQRLREAYNAAVEGTE